ncbi:glycoside hydrolase 43 family protein [Actinoplanes sp. OR16]|uniref:glycoside hydrolase family 43 protein n=1 Tax=Actinoplanes sp. OR16 TaxID=946334 RepID=UPI000F6BAE40|nr:glycoside hydrolase family 43 protein [Actinoplanes sp. OR16]BBH69311.1 glycoside hydrolase 43 family protein [Actinoplanes sp. OR16]
MTIDTEPVISGFHPDPSVCRVGEDYYLICSSFEYFPGVPIFHSRDLVGWQQIGNVVTRASQFDPTGAAPSTGIYAPTLRHHDGRFWLTTTIVNRLQDGQLIMHAGSATGPWSDPVFVPGTIGIDPDLSWDSAGNCYLTYKGFHDPGGIMQVRIDPLTGAKLDDIQGIWQGTGMAHPEGPHLYEIDGTWYLLIAEGGTERGHTVTIARGPSPSGPFEPGPDNPILTRRSTTHPVQNTGHADLVQDTGGAWWMVHLGVRPRGYTPAFHVIGRETFLAPVTWKDGWPVVTSTDRPVPDQDHSFSEDFTAPVTHPRWITPSTSSSSGPSCVRVKDLRWSAETTLSPGPHRSHLTLRLDDRHWYALMADTSSITAVAHIGDLEQALASVPPPASGTVTLRIEAVDPPHEQAGPDEIVLSAGGVELARLDGRYLSTEVAGGFTGRVLCVERVLAFSYISKKADQ